MRYYVLASFLFVSGFIACKRINPPLPPCEAQVVIIPKDTSYLSTPLVISTKLLEDKINRAIRVDLVNDDKFEENNNEGKQDKLKMKVTRLGDIKVRWKDNVASYDAPLHVLIERQILSDKVLPKSKSLALKTEFSLRLACQTAVDIGTDWKLQPKTKFVSFEWLSEVTAFGGLLDIKKMVERRLLRQMPQILENMDDTIRAKVRLDHAISRVWRNIQKPMIINRKQELVWLKINPIQFEMGKITTESGNIMIQGRLSATTETLLGDNPEYAVDSTLPRLVKRPELPDHAYLYMLSEISYQDINAVIGEKLAGKSFEVSGHKIKINSAEVWGCPPNLMLHLDVQGDVKGDIYLLGLPQYEPDSQQIVIRNFEFEVKTQETLLSSADWLLHDTFKEQLRTALSVPLAEKIVKIPDAIMEGIERGRAGQKMDFIIDQWDFKPQKIWVRPSNIATLIIVDARVRIELEKI